MSLATLVLLATLGQTCPLRSDPFVRSDIDACSQDPLEPCLYWTRPTLVWQQSRAGNPDTPNPEEFAAIRRSFASWQALLAECGNMTLAEGTLSDVRTSGFARDAAANQNLVLFRTRRCSAVAPASDACWDDGSCGNEFDCWEDEAFGDQTIAITLTTYDEASGIIIDSDIELNAAPHRDGGRYVFSTTTPPSCDSASVPRCRPTDIQNTVTHEVGHLLGLDHTSATGSTMNPNASPLDISKRTIDPGSRDFICSVYPRGQPSQSCVTPTLPDDDALGARASSCTAAGGGPAATGGWALVVAGGLLLRRRRAAR